MTRIYSDITGEVLTTEGQSQMVQIFDKEQSWYHPALILPDMLAVWKMRNYLDEIVKKNKDYMRRAGLSLEPPKQ